MNDKKGKSLQQNIIYNTVGSLVYYISQWVMTVLIVRMSGFNNAGILSLAMSVTAAPGIIGLFNIRSYQVSDINSQFSNRVYFVSRIFTSALSFVICAIITIFGGYSFDKVAVIMIFMCFKVAESIADVYYGVDQKNGRMDYAGISLTVRGIGSLALFLGLFLFTQSLFISILGMTAFSFAVIFLYDARKASDILITEEKEESVSVLVKKLLIICFPLAVVAFLNNLSIIIPRLFLEKFHGEEIMGIYSSVSSPTIVIQLAATTIFAPLIPMLAIKFNNGEKKSFNQIIRKFSLLVLILTIVFLIGSKFLAEWALILLFGSEIASSAYLFIPIIVISILIGINASLFSICTLMREIKSQYLIGAVGVVSSVLLSLWLVKKDSMVGVVVAITGSLLLQILIQIILIVRRYGDFEKNKLKAKQ